MLANKYMADGSMFVHPVDPVNVVTHSNFEHVGPQSDAIEWFSDERPDSDTDNWNNLYGILILLYRDLSSKALC
jgi:hypothetical protein